MAFNFQIAKYINEVCCHSSYSYFLLTSLSVLGGGGASERQWRETGWGSPGENLKSRVPEMRFEAFWVEVLQNSEDYNKVHQRHNFLPDISPRI